jgi:acyl carrier protein
MQIQLKETVNERVRDAVVAAVAQVLGRAEVGPADHLFALGTSSLAAALISNALESRLGIDVPIRLLYEQPVVGDLAAALTAVIAEHNPNGVTL